MQNDLTIAAQFVETEVSVGDLDQAAWATTRPAYIQRYWSGAEAPASRHAEARCIWSAKSLTVRFLCQQHEPLVVSSDPELHKKTIGLWERDVCELFIAPDATTPHRYLEFEVAPTGEWLDLIIEFVGGERHTDWEFSSGMTAAARVRDQEVMMAMQIPWSRSLPKPDINDVWRANLFRCVGLGSERYLAWQPTRTPEPNFHVPEAFGRLEFI